MFKLVYIIRKDMASPEGWNILKTTGWKEFNSFCKLQGDQHTKFQRVSIAKMSGDIFGDNDT